MEDHNCRQLSENEQMYLVTIAKLHESGNQGLIPLSDLAETLSFLPVSVNQMIRKLADDGLLQYQPYKGVDFTESGSQMVLRILRYRRLWEVFLVKHLKMDLDEADALACRMEHITSDQVSERLAAFLDYPTVCYHGHPIPSLEEKTTAPITVPLAQLAVGEAARVNNIEADPAARSFLHDEGFLPGSQVTALGIGDDQAMLLEINNRQVYLTADLASSVVVEYQSPEFDIIPSSVEG